MLRNSAVFELSRIGRLGGACLAALLWAPLAFADPAGNPPTANSSTNATKAVTANSKPEKSTAPIPVKIEVAEDGTLRMDQTTNLAYAEKGVVITYGEMKLLSDRARYNTITHDVWAEGNVHVYNAGIQWTGETLYYNFDTRQTIFGKFRVFDYPWYIRGEKAEKVGPKYVIKNGFVTTCDYEVPHWGLTAKTVDFYPEDKIVARDVTARVDDIPVFYMPYVSKSLKNQREGFDIEPGDSSRFGPYLLVGYNWFYSPALHGTVHADYREKRGPAGGIDLFYNDKTYGKGRFNAYFMNDARPNDQDVINQQETVPHQRYRVSWQNQTQLRDDVTFKANIEKQSDSRVVEEFWRREFHAESQPISNIEIAKYDPGYGLSLWGRPQMNSFFTTTERTPELDLDIKRQQLFGSPVYYQSELSVAHLNKSFSDIELPQPDDYNAMRFDWLHQIYYPQTYFGWLSVVPRVGIRETWYNRTPLGRTTAPDGTVNYYGDGGQKINMSFPLGFETSFKMSEVYDVNSPFWDVHGLRHIIQPVADVTYLPTPTTSPGRLYQFDTTSRFDPNMATSRLLPTDPSFNQIDALDRMETVQAGFRNKLQTKRDGQSVDFVNMNLYGEWRGQPVTGQTTFSDVYTELEAQPLKWVSFDFDSRVDEKGKLKEANAGIRFLKERQWEIAFSRRYIRDTDYFFGGNSDFYALTTQWAITENWAIRTTHYYEAELNLLEQQEYSIIRDLHDWEASLNFRTLDNGSAGKKEYDIYVVVTLKALPGMHSNANMGHY